jgi:WD40 repeat protein
MISSKSRFAFRSYIPTILLFPALVGGCCFRNRCSYDTDPFVREIPHAISSIALDAHEGRIVRVAFEPLGNRLISLSEDGSSSSTMNLWHGAAGRLIETFPNENFADCDVIFSNDAGTIALGSGTVMLIDTDDYRLKRTLEAEMYEQLKILDMDREMLWPFSIKTYMVLQKYRFVTALAFSPDDRYMASGHENGQVKVWNPVTGELLDIMWATKVFGRILDVEFSPDGRYIAACQDDDKIRVWRFPGGEEKILQSGGKSIYSLAFDPVTGSLAAGGADGTVWIYDVESGKLVGSIEGHEKAILTIRFSKDGRSLVTAGRDNTVRIWNYETGDVITVLEGHEKQINSVSLNSNASLLASGSDDGIVRIWDISSLTLTSDPRLTPLPIDPASLAGSARFENGSLIVSLLNEGGGAAYNIVVLCIPDSGREVLEIVQPPLVPMILPGGSVEVTVSVTKRNRSQVGEAGMTIRVYESNGFHLSPPLRVVIPVE